MKGPIGSTSILVCVFVLFTAACGGGRGTGGVQSSPPAPDFSLEASLTAVSVTQGGTSAVVTVSITPRNNFSDAVQVNLSGLPMGVVTNPPSPFSVAAGQSVPLLFGAGADAPTGQFNLIAQATSGSLTHSAQLSLEIQALRLTGFPLTSYVENDSVPSVDQPSGEPHRRHIVFDPGHQRFYIANAAMNRVEVMTVVNPELEASISVPGAASVDMSPDGNTLWVGTTLEQVDAIDVATLQVRSRYPISALMPIPGTAFGRATEAIALSGGGLLLRMRATASSQALLAYWNSVSNTLTNLTSSAPAVFQHGVGVLGRSGDHRRVLVAANDASGELAIFDGNGTLLVGPLAPLEGTVTATAANADGSAFAVALNGGSGSQVLLLDSNLNLAGSYKSSGPVGVVFSRDGSFLYVSEPYGTGSAITALSTATLQSVGQVSDLLVQGVSTAIEEVGATSNVAGLNNRGVGFIDVSSPGSLPPVAPSFSAIPAAEPSEGPVVGGTAVSLEGVNFTATVQVRFGSGAPMSAIVASASEIQVTSPTHINPGPVDITAYFSNGWVAVAPSSFSYGPAIVRVLPNAGAPAGGDTICVYGFGFGTNAGNITATVGGNVAAVQSVDALPAFSAALGLDSKYPFALERLTLKTPAGSLGKAEVKIQSPAGSVSAAGAYQYVASRTVFSSSGLHKFLTYDQSRQRLFLSATDHVDVFDLSNQVFVTPIQPPPNGPPPSAALRGLALTPDSKQLIIADFGAQKIYLTNPDGSLYNGEVVPVGGVAGFLNSGPARVSATNDGTVFVSLSGEGGSSGGCNGCLGQMNLLAAPPTFQPAPQPEVSALTGVPLLQTDAAGDLAYLAYDMVPGGPIALWNSVAPSIFSLAPSSETATDLATAGDGTSFAVRARGGVEIRGANLALFSTPSAAEREQMPNRVTTPGMAMHASGALLYEPFMDGPAPAAPPAIGIHGGIDIRDAHSGELRLRVYLPEALAMLSSDIDGLHGSFLAIDESGQRLFALTTSGLTIVQLANVPLGIGTLSPSSGPATGGTSVTLRGSGFQSGAKVMLGGKTVAATLKDINTLTVITPALAGGPQQLIVTNPDGESVSQDAAFLAQ